jgi:putative transposase
LNRADGLQFCAEEGSGEGVWDMPFEQELTTDLRVRFMGEWASKETDFSKLCRRYGISRPTGYKWVKRYEEEGVSGLEERTHDAKKHPNALAENMEDLVLKARGKHPTWGPKKLVAWIGQKGGLERVCAPSTAGEILRRHGLSHAQQRARRTTPWSDPLGQFEEANAVWCVDFKGWFRLGNGARCDPLTITDGYSRYLLRCQALRAIGLESSRRIFEAAFREYGLPQRIRSDNGAPFGSVAIGGLSALAVWFLRLGIVPERIEPGQPYQNGRHERMHLTLNEAVEKPAYDLHAQQRRFNTFRRCFNEERPHEALGQKTPGSAYQASVRNYHGQLPEMEYESGVVTRKVQRRGEIKWNGEGIFLSETLRGETIGLRELPNAQWEIRFGAMVLGTLDERTRKITPKERPRKRRRR